MRFQFVTCVVVPFVAITLSTAPLGAQEWGNKMFDRLQLQFGNVARSADTTFSVKVTNPYVEEIRITSLTTSCGCISWTDPLPISLPSKAERELTIRLDTVRHVGEKHVKAFVTLNEPTKGLVANVTLSVDGRIRNDVEVRPSLVDFGAVDLGQGQSQRLRVDFSGHSHWEITSAKVASAYLTTQIVEHTRAVGVVQYDIVVELKPGAPVGVLRDRLVLTTNEIGNPRIEIPVEARIEPEFVVTEAHFGMVTSGHPKSITVMLRGKKPFQIQSVEHVTQVVAAKPAQDAATPTDVSEQSDVQITDAKSAFKTEFPASLAQIHLLTLTLTPPMESGRFNEQFSITIQGREHPVTFQANGRIVK